MNILQKYLFKEYLQYWYSITSILILILISDNLASILTKVIQGVIDSNVIFPLFIANIFQFSVNLIPLGLFLGIMLGMGRLYHESEMASSFACGLEPKNILKPTLLIGFIGCLIVSFLVFSISPWAARIEQKIIFKEKTKQEIDKIEIGKFNISKDNKRVIFVKEKEKEKLKTLFVEFTNENGGKSIALSDSANIATRFDHNGRYFIFEEGNFTSTDNQTITNYKEHGILLASEKEKEKQNIKMASASTWSLINSNGIQEKAELHWRIALPISSIMLALLALPLSHSAPRKGRYSRLIVAILLYLLYVNILIFARKSIENGLIPREAGFWWVHLLIISLVIYLNFRRQKYG